MVARVLLEYDAETRIGGFRCTLTTSYRGGKNLAIIRWLLARLLRRRERPGDRRLTPLHVAAFNEFVEVVEHLRGDPHPWNNSGDENPFQVVSNRDYPEVARLLSKGITEEMYSMIQGMIRFSNIVLDTQVHDLVVRI
jgi:hypothetical protein